VKRVFFEESWVKFFAEFKLKSFDDFFVRCFGQTVNKNNKRDVITFKLGKGELEKQFFMKRFFHPHFKDMFFTLRNFGRRCSQARCEWENIKLLFGSGVRTYSLVCYGEKIKWGMESKSFIVTEKLEGRSLADFAQQNWQQLDRQQKEKIIVDLAKFIRKIHRGKFSLPDLYVWHIFLTEKQAGGGWEFAVIDLHRMSQNVTSQGQQLKNLGRLLHSAVDKYFDEGLKRLFIESYAGDDWDGDINALIARVKKYSDKVSAKRKPKPY
jgi:tRNA A-37 threonylcarbamoyl transferase component Bud32